jgi:hypothetical protein
VQWSNGCRQRLYLSYPKKNGVSEDHPPESGKNKNKRILEVLKSNWGPRGDGIELTWNDWFFYAENEDLMSESSEAAETQARANQMARAETEFLRMLVKAEQMNMVLSSQPTARTNAATMFARDAVFSECLFRGDSGYGLLKQAMANLFANGAIENVPFGSPSQHKFRIVMVHEAVEPLKYDFQILGPEPDHPCEQCHKKSGKIYLIRDPFREVKSHALHEECASAFYGREDI